MAFYSVGGSNPSMRNSDTSFCSVEARETSEGGLYDPAEFAAMRDKASDATDLTVGRIPPFCMVRSEFFRWADVHE